MLRMLHGMRAATLMLAVLMLADADLGVPA